jgi:outer membrane protein assembly factor BamE (lipoprotein component of BamABCDE complex)
MFALPQVKSNRSNVSGTAKAATSRRPSPQAITLLPVTFILTAVLLSGCQTANQHMADVQAGMTGETLSVGKVQREISVGMSSATVIEVLGAPNIVTTDDQRREVWVYDKIATDRAYSSSSGGISTLFLGFGAGFGGLGGAGANASSGAASTSQRTLTIIIKFDKTGQVRDFAYHQSKF